MDSGHCTVEKLTEAIKLVENLRSSVYLVFDDLVGGKTISDGIKDHRAINDKEKGWDIFGPVLDASSFSSFMI